MSFETWPLAPVDHLVYKAELALTQSSDQFTVEQFPMDEKIPLNGECSLIMNDQGISGLAVKYLFGIAPFFKAVTTEIRAPQQASYNDFDAGEAVPLQQRARQIDLPIAFGKWCDEFYFYDRTSEQETGVRSRAIPEAVLVEKLCGGPKPHIKVGFYSLRSISPEGIPSLFVTLKEINEHCDHLHTSFISKPIARFFGLENREMLVAVGNLQQAGLLERGPTTFQVPKQPIITARKIDTAALALVGATLFGAAAKTYKANYGGITMTAVAASIYYMYQAFSRYYR